MNVQNFRFIFYSRGKMYTGLRTKFGQHKVASETTLTRITQNIAETCQKYFQSFIVTEIFSQYFFQILQNISSQNYNFNFMEYFWKQIII